MRAMPCGNLKLCRKRPFSWSAPARRSPPTVVVGLSAYLSTRSQAQPEPRLQSSNRERRKPSACDVISDDLISFEIAGHLPLNRSAPARRSPPTVVAGLSAYLSTRSQAQPEPRLQSSNRERRKPSACDVISDDLISFEIAGHLPLNRRAPSSRSTPSFRVKSFPKNLLSVAFCDVPFQTRSNSVCPKRNKV